MRGMSSALQAERVGTPRQMLFLQADPVFRYQVLRVFRAIWVMVAVLLAAGICQAGSYKWTDREGTLHLSDTPPAGEVPLEDLDPADPGQRPLLGKQLLIYSDATFRLFLSAEEDDLLQFELVYTDIHRAFPDIVASAGRIFVCAVGRQEGYSYLSYSVAAVEGGSKRLQLTNALSRHSPDDLETESLRILFHTNGTGNRETRSLFTTDIPFGKSWQKRKGKKYQ